MRARVFVLILGAVIALPLACKQDEQPPAQQPVYQQQPGSPQQYPQQQYPAQPGAQPTAMPAPVATQPAAMPTAAQPVPAATGSGAPLSQPSPMALPCTSDAACLTHRCNTQFGKCAWPCQSDNDCNPGNHCMAGACIPQMPGQ